MHKKFLKFALVVELAQPKFTYITVLKWPKLGHVAKTGKQTVLSRSSGPWSMHIVNFPISNFMQTYLQWLMVTCFFISFPSIFTYENKSTALWHLALFPLAPSHVLCGNINFQFSTSNLSSGSLLQFFTLISNMGVAPRFTYPFGRADTTPPSPSTHFRQQK